MSTARCLLLLLAVGTAPYVNGKVPERISKVKAKVMNTTTGASAVAEERLGQIFDQLPEDDFYIRRLFAFTNGTAFIHRAFKSVAMTLAERGFFEERAPTAESRRGGPLLGPDGFIQSLRDRLEPMKGAALSAIMAMLATITSFFMVTEAETASSRGAAVDDWELDHTVWMERLSRDLEYSWDND